MDTVVPFTADGGSSLASFVTHPVFPEIIYKRPSIFMPARGVFLAGNTMNANTILAPPIAFLVFLALGLLLDYAGSRLAIERTEDGGFRTTYTGGEEWPEDATFKPEYRLYHVAIGFTVLHIAVLLIATMPIEDAVLGLEAAVLGIVFVTFFALLRGGLKP